MSNLAYLLLALHFVGWICYAAIAAIVQRREARWTTWGEYTTLVLVSFIWEAGLLLALWMRLYQWYEIAREEWRNT